MVVMKMAHMKHIPEYCDDCIYYGCKPHPYKGWTDSCELCMQCLDDDQEKGWIYDGNGRPANCPLMEVDDLQSESEHEPKSEWQKDHEILKAYSDGANGVLDEIRAEIAEEKEHAYADFERYKVEYLGQDGEDVLDNLPQDDFRYGMERCIDIIDKYKAESEDKE